MYPKRKALRERLVYSIEENPYDAERSLFLCIDRYKLHELIYVINVIKRLAIGPKKLWERDVPA